MKNLRHLSLKCHHGVWSFEGGLLPILQKFGPSTLEKLELDGFPEVDVSAIAKYCPSLRSLSLINMDRFITPSQQLKPPDNRLQRLEHLKIAQCDDDNFIVQQFTTADLLILLSSPALVSLEFGNFEGRLSDQVIEKAALLYGFPNLQELTMEMWGELTPKLIDFLLTLDNPLKKIVLRQIDRGAESENLAKWEGLAKKNNWDLSITID